MVTTRDVIRELSREHLVENNGILASQCVTAVGWIANTVPDDIPHNEGIIELPTSDSSNGGVMVGAALAGRRPIYVVRYQGFMTYNAASIVNYAAKSKTLWGKPCPIFVRAIANEGAIGPVATGMHHGLIGRYPGIKIFAPMTPSEWLYAWENFLANDDPVYCSEHRSSYTLTDDCLDCEHDKDADTIIMGIGAARINVVESVKRLRENGHRVTPYHLFNLTQGFEGFGHLFRSRKDRQRRVLVVDGDYAQCGISQRICHSLNNIGVKNTYAYGLYHGTAGFAECRDVVTPSADSIVKMVNGWSRI